MQKPFIYTMPEEFVKDSNVPARWRVLAVLNGFFLNGKKCWASNEWIAKEIRAHKDTVSQAVKELEDLKLIVCQRTRRTRLVAQIQHPEIGANAYQTQCPTPISHRHQRLSTSESNAVKESSAPKGAVSPLPVVEFVESSKSPRVPRDNTAMRLREWCYKQIEDDTGVYPSPNMGDYKRIVAALKHLGESEIKEMMEDAIDQGKGQTVRGVFTDRAIDIYRQQNA